MKLGSLFSGIGGLEVALEAEGMETIWQSEIDPHASKVLANHWPNVPNHGDITKIDWANIEPVDVMCLGFPCQDISLAGKGAGITDGTRSGLWSYAAHAIGILRPRIVFIENVSALVVRGLDRVLCDLAEIGFDAEWTCVRASDVGAPHRRERLFLVATDTQSERWEKGILPQRATAEYSELGGGNAVVGNTDESVGDQWRKSAPSQAQGRRAWTNAGGSGRAPIANTHGDGLVGIAQLNSTTQPRVNGEHRRHSNGCDLEESGDTRLGISGPQVSWGDYELPIRRWAALTRHAPPPTDDRGRLSASFVEWMMGLPRDWVSDIPRTQQLKCLGNAVVPQQARYAWNQLIGW